MHSLNLLDIEGQAPQSVLCEKVPDLVWIVQRVLRENGDDRGLDIVLLQQLDATQRPLKGSPTSSVNALSIVNVPRPIQADPDLDVMALDEIAPLLIDQRAIGLEAMDNAHSLRVALLGNTKSLLVEGNGQDEWLASMPDNGDRIGQPDLAEKPFKGALKRLISDTLCRGSVWQIAIAAVDITKGRGLDDDQFCPCLPGIWHFFHPCLHILRLDSPEDDCFKRTVCHCSLTSRHQEPIHWSLCTG
jgi:hypothetical protein